MVSDKMYKLGAERSVIRDLFEYGNQRAKEIGRENVFDFSLGNPSVPAPKEVFEAVLEIMNCESSVIHGYTPAVGSENTRKAIADDLNDRFGTKYEPSELYMTCGAAASLISVLRALICSENSEIVVIAPFFPEYKCFTEANGGKFKIVDADEAEFQINFDSLEKVISANTAGIIVNSPNNPSGSVYSEDTVKKLADFLCKKQEEYGHAIYIIADEPYRELVYDGDSAPFIPNYYKNTIVCYSYSKSLSLPGERIGYVLVPKEADDSGNVFNAVAGAARASGYVCAPSLMQHVIAKCASVRPNTAEYRKNRDLLYNSLTEMGYECVYPKGAFYLFVKAPGGDGNKFSEIAKQFNLLLVPGESFGCKKFLRISYCVSTEMIEASLPSFKKAIECI